MSTRAERANSRWIWPPSMLVGTDIIAVEEVAEAIRQFGARYISRIYTRSEASYCTSAGSDSAPYFAARFAAKEATLKVLRPASNEPIDWRSIEVSRSAEGWCDMRLHGTARALARRRGLVALAVSLSHEKRYATAVIVAERAWGRAPAMGRNHNMMRPSGR